LVGGEIDKRGKRDAIGFDAGDACSVGFLRVGAEEKEGEG
jgi:hypothetical protein